MNVVIQSEALDRTVQGEARNLALQTKDLRDSPSPAAPQNDSVYEFFRSLLEMLLPRHWEILPRRGLCMA